MLIAHTQSPALILMARCAACATLECVTEHFVTERWKRDSALKNVPKWKMIILSCLNSFATATV
jgi:hypothetical protein